MSLSRNIIDIDLPKKTIFNMLVKSPLDRSEFQVDSIAEFLFQISGGVLMGDRVSIGIMRGIAKFLILKKFKQGQNIFMYGDTEPKNFYFILAGKVSLLKPINKELAISHIQNVRTGVVDPNVIPIREGKLGPLSTVKLKQPHFYFSAEGRDLFSYIRCLVKGESFGQILLMYQSIRTMVAVAGESSLLGILGKCQFSQCMKDFMVKQKRDVQELVLQFLPKLKGLKSKQLYYSIKRLSFNYGDKIYQIGDDIYGFFLVRQGQISLSIRAKGRLVDIIKLTSGDVFGTEETGERKYFQKLKKRRFRATALCSTSVYMLPLEDIKQIDKTGEYLQQIIKKFAPHAALIQQLLNKYTNQQPKIQRNDQQPDNRFKWANERLDVRIRKLQKQKRERFACISKMSIFERVNFSDFKAAWRFKRGGMQ